MPIKAKLFFALESLVASTTFRVSQPSEALFAATIVGERLIPAVPKNNSGIVLE